MAESLLLPVVRGVVRKAGDVLVKSVAGMWGVDNDRRKLERQLLAVQCKLADAEVKSETNQYIKRWMKDLRTVAYEADDVLDEFQYEALRREAQIGDSKIRKLLCHFTGHSPLLFRLIMSRKLNNVLDKVNNLVSEMNMFGLENRVEAPLVLYRQTHSVLDDSEEVFGREDDKEMVVKLLVHQQDQQKVQVLPIFGMGGLGKTTLAKMVYNDHRVQQHFQLNMWHCVSENFEATALVKSIIELATNGRCDLPDTIELLRRRLEEVIGWKRFLLVLDDVWNEKERKWEDEVKPLLCSVGAPGSVIVVTCRSQQVASIMGTVGSHELKCLSEDDSWELFSKKAFSKGVQEQAELVSIGRCIVRKCRGLPLALKTMGGLMSSKQQAYEWEAIQESNIGNNVGGKDEILPVLKLSYRHLSSEMKLCFAFCALFPKDYEMEKDKLIQLWIANGFIQEEETMSLVQKGEFVFHYLVWRSFIQDVKANELHMLVSCKMHDLMHDLAKDVTNECTTIEGLIQEKVWLEDTRHMKIEDFELKNNSGVLKGTPSLRTLLAPSTSHKNLMKINMMPLRALQYDDASSIHSQIINAKHLRYLDLYDSGAVTLPDSICLLYNLQTLRLNRCSNLRRLPEGITAMRKLLHLYLIGCDYLERMPANIGLLTNIHTLTTFIVDTKAGCGIEELKELRHLGNRLELYNLRKIKSGKKAKEANLHEKQNLSGLLLCWGRNVSDNPEDEPCKEEEVLESLTPHSKLRSLQVYGYCGLKMSQWMRDPRMFQCLRKLTISNCPRCKDLPVVWLSDSLEYLSVVNMGNLTILCKSTEVEAQGYTTPLQFFPKLKEVTLRELPNLENWGENSAGEPNSLLMFPCLEELRIINCPKLATVPGSPVLKNVVIEGSLSIPSMSICSWPSNVTLEIQSLASMTMPLRDDQRRSQSKTRPLETLRKLSLRGPNCFATTPRLSMSQLVLWECFAFVEVLTIHECNELVRWPKEELQGLARLRALHISYCDNLEGKDSSSEETLPLPQLESVCISGCPSLLEIPKLPASLERLIIYYCENLVGLPSNLANLRLLHLVNCESLKALADGMDDLTSLEELCIHWCPGIQEFPQGLLQRPPAVKSLCILACPELERRCKEGGEYFHLFSSIPFRYIRPAETESTSKKKLLRRLLSSCADSN